MIAIVEILATEPTSDERAQLLKPLMDFNSSHTATVPEWPHLCIVLRQPKTGEIVGGLYASDELNWLFVKYLVVLEALRGKGLGRQLMGEAERIARERGYRGIFLDTYDFQARPFYIKLGYEQFGELDGDERTPRRYFLRKLLPSMTSTV
ncbi:GNAT family N-acetyltransferase [Rhizobium sp. P38BS-XIX]|nr:GNAT family N-acetyltransferase [Rhizobium sp. P38BS-XIX]